MADLWVRTQKKDLLVKIDSVRVTDGSPLSMEYDASIYDDEKSIFLGSYKTKERALEVLDEIQLTLQKTAYGVIKTNKNFNMDKFVETLNKYQIVEIPKDATIEYNNVDTIIYEMPKN